MKSIEENEVPLLVSLTSGTTVLGAFDPIRPVADICEKYKIWLHVDVSFCLFLYFCLNFKNNR
jgi:glutamate/tyrosine decarboxylase-like PLP-dependent enzyme